MNEAKVNAVLKNIETEYFSRKIRSTYVNRRLLTRERFRATCGDEIALSKRLLLIRIRTCNYNDT